MPVTAHSPCIPLTACRPRLLSTLPAPPRHVNVTTPPVLSLPCTSCGQHRMFTCHYSHRTATPHFVTAQPLGLPLPQQQNPAPYQGGLPSTTIGHAPLPRPLSGLRRTRISGLCTFTRHLPVLNAHHDLHLRVWLPNNDRHQPGRHIPYRRPPPRTCASTPSNDSSRAAHPNPSPAPPRFTETRPCPTRSHR